MKLKKEKECIELFKKILGTQNVKTQHKFDFIVGDKGTKLPVDAYFPEYNLVLEYMGRQHYEDIPLMNRKPGRKEQRKRYDKLRIKKLKENNIKLIKVKYDEGLTKEMVMGKLKNVKIRIK